MHMDEPYFTLIVFGRSTNELVGVVPFDSATCDLVSIVYLFFILRYSDAVIVRCYDLTD